MKFLLLAFVCCLTSLAVRVPCSAQAAPAESENPSLVQDLYRSQQWQQVIEKTNDGSALPPELSYLRGMALMRLDRYSEARDAFSAGLGKSPSDSRFYVERAGAEYRLKDLADAKSDLRHALRLRPRDEYTVEFLGTIYLLEGNLDAALKYWNRNGKPRLLRVALLPQPRLAAKLVSTAVTFNAPQVLDRNAWLGTDARLENLGIFPQRRWELAPASEQDYAAILHVTERNGRDNLRWPALVSLLGGVPYQTVYPDWYNLGSRAINFSSMVRWDKEKRRVFASLSLPVEGRADRTVSFFLDGRNENWDLSQTFFASATPVNHLNVQRLAAGAELRFVRNGDWSWRAGASVVGRTFQNAGTTTSGEAAALFANGTSLEGRVGARHVLLRVPERRFTVTGSAESQFGRAFKAGLGPFGTLGGSLQADWMPHSSGDQDAVEVRLRGANTFGRVPLDQLFELGLDRDSPLWLRGHAATIDGKKGRAPLGRRFVLINSEYDRTLYDGGLFRVQAGPLLDLGKVTDSSGAIGDARWLVDLGVQVKLRVLGSVSVVLSYGRDLRNGRGTLFGTTDRYSASQTPYFR